MMQGTSSASDIALRIKSCQLCYYSETVPGTFLSIYGDIKIGSNEEWHPFNEFNVCRASAVKYIAGKNRSIPDNSIGFLDMADNDGLVILSDDAPIQIYSLFNIDTDFKLLFDVRAISDLDFAITKMKFYITK